MKITHISNNLCIKDKITREVRKFFVLNEIENTTYQSVQDATGGIIRGKCIALRAYIRNSTLKNDLQTFACEQDAVKVTRFTLSTERTTKSAKNI